MRSLSLCLLFLSTLLFADPLPNAQFVSSEGKPLQFYDLKGQVVFVSFIFTRCPLPKMCPLTMTLNKQLWRKAKNSKPETKIKFLIVTLDPDFDTAPVLKTYAKKFNLDEKDFLLVTGNPQVLSDFASLFNVLGFPSQGSISHNLKSALIGKDLSVIKEYKENEWKADQVLLDLKTASAPLKKN